jgi:uncharacterized protein YutE (UPF0331/DUF86 family)
MHREVNIEKLKTLEKDLSDTISEIRTIIAIEEEVFLGNSKEIYALRYLLIEAVEAMANMCNHLLARTIGQVPKGYPDCFEKLSAAQIITEELSGKLTKVASLRNILIHKYWEIDNRRVFRSTKENIGDFELFLQQVNEFIRK